MVPESHVQNAVSLNSALMMGSRIIGPALAGVLIHSVGYGWCFLLDGLSYLAVIAGLGRMDTSQLRRGPVAARARGQVRAGLRYVRSVPDLWVSLVMMAVIGCLAFNFQVVFPLFATRSLDGGDGAFTLLYSVVSVGSLVGALATARTKLIDLRRVEVTAVGLGVSMLALAAMPNLASALPLAVVLGVTSIAFMTTSTSIVQLRADPGMRGRVMALQSIVFIGSTPIGGPVLGVICEAFGARAGLVVGGAACFAAAAWGVRAGRRIRPPATAPRDAELVAA
jgi:predicted MFS family arabinose efflux permease